MSTVAASALLGLAMAIHAPASTAEPDGDKSDKPKDRTSVEQGGGTDAGTDQGGYWVGVEEYTANEIVSESNAAPPAKSQAVASSSAPPSCLDALGTPDCQIDWYCGPGTLWAITAYLVTPGGIVPVGACPANVPVESASHGQAAITPGRVLQAFRRIPLPAAKLDIQPPGGKTLVNLDTIFSTSTGDLDRTVTLLGRRVQLRITPTSYTWHHGDGTTQTSDWPGRPWEEHLDMDTYLTHAYEDAHVTARPSVDVTYSADYRIGNGPWQPVNGTVTIEGPPASLRIVEARPVLTGAGRP